MKSREKIYSYAAILIIIDQLVKILIRTKMTLNSSIPIIPNVFNLTYVENKGAAFSILENNQIFLILLAFIFLFLIDYYIKKEKKFSKLSIISLGIIIGGIIGNLVDRLLLHAVVDYFDFTLINFAIFNIADMGITIGVLLLIISTIKDEVNEKKKKKGEPVRYLVKSPTGLIQEVTELPKQAKNKESKQNNKSKKVKEIKVEETAPKKEKATTRKKKKSAK